MTKDGKQIFSASPFTLLKEIVIPEDTLGCSKGDAPKDGSDGDSWWSWSKKHNPSKDKIVLAERGQCTFEEKTEVAISNGAKGLIVLNNEDSLFIMASRHDPAPVKAKNTAVQANSGQPTKAFPTVMLTKSDGDNMLAVIHSLQEKMGLTPMYYVEVSSVPMILETEIMGCFNYPKVHVRDKLIVVYGRGPWGVMLTSTLGTGKEWQLFILSKFDMMSVTPWKVESQGGREMTTTTDFNYNSVQLFSLLLSQKCPPDVAMLPDSGAVVVRKYSYSPNQMNLHGRGMIKKKGRVFPKLPRVYDHHY